MSQYEAVPRGASDPASGGPGTSPDASVRPAARSGGVLSLLQDVALKMSQRVSVEEALHLAIDRICRYTDWPVGHAYLLSSESGRLVSSGVFFLVDAERFDAFRRAALDEAFAPGEGLPGHVLSTGRSHWVPDIHEDANFPRAAALRSLGLVTAFGCPILIGDRAVGVVEFFSTKKKELDDDFISVASNIGAQLGRVIEREQSAEVIRASEERLRALTESLVEAIITSDDEGIITDWSAGAEETFGYAAEEAIGRSVELIMPERYTAAHRRGMERYRTTLDPKLIGSTLETTAVRKDGAEIPVELSLSTWSARGRRYFTAVIRDVSERHRADAAIRMSQEQLRRREQQLERAQQIAHLGMWEWDVQSGTLTWSDELYKIYGLEPGSEMTYDLYESLHHPEDRGIAREIVQKALETHGSFSFRHRILRADTGEIRVLHGEGEVETDEAGAVVKMFGTALDVTEFERVEEDLRESERKFRLLAENMTDLILLQEPSGDLIYVSPSARRILGYDPQELYGANFYDLLEEEDAARLRQGAHGEMLEGRSYTEVLVRARARDGATTWVELASKPIVGKNGAVEMLLTSARDVTERVRAEAEASRYRSQLELRNRELQDFAYVASHDLQEPLRKIRAFSDLVEEEYGSALGEEGRQFLGRVKDAATRMSTLINDLLTFSRVTTSGGSFEETDLNEILEGVLSDLEIAIRESDARITSDTLPVLEADPVQMRQLFQNLIGNAIKFARPEEAPRIEIRSQLRTGREDASSQQRTICRLEVADNGVGFDPKYADRIFSPFQRLHNRVAVEGTGMGLAICRRIVERHEGVISVDSAPDEGSTFAVEIPVQHYMRGGT